MMSHLPALQVVVPLLVAPICFLLGRFRRVAWLLATLVAWICLAIAIGLWWQVKDGAELHYAFGGWAPPWGIDYVVDRLNVLVLLIVSGIAAVVFPAAWTSIQKEVPEERHGLLFTNLLLCLAGLTKQLPTCVTDYFQLSSFKFYSRETMENWRNWV